MSGRDPMRELLSLARKLGHAEPPRRDATSFRAFEQQLRRRRSPVRARLVFAAVGVAVVLGGVVFALTGGYDGPKALEYHVSHASETGAGARTDQDLSRLTFSDGSVVSLGRQSQALVRATTARGATLRLARGSLDARIVHRRGGDWWFEAGPYSVHVTGTAFSMRWSPEPARFELSMHSGSVTVTGPRAEGGIALERGERLRIEGQALEVSPVDERTTEAARLPSEEEKPALASVPEVEAPETQLDPVRSRTSARDKSSPETGEFGALVARGEFGEVLAAARRMDLSRVLARAPRADLAALADAARYQGDLPLARRALSTLRSRFKREGEARAAAYFLALISRGQDALAWYQIYLREDPEGPFAAGALGASMTLQVQHGKTAEAATLARDYLRRDPKGPYAAAARELLETRRKAERQGNASP